MKAMKTVTELCCKLCEIFNCNSNSGTILLQISEIQQDIWLDEEDDSAVTKDSVITATSNVL